MKRRLVGVDGDRRPGPVLEHRRRRRSRSSAGPRSRSPFSSIISASSVNRDARVAGIPGVVGHAHTPGRPTSGPVRPSGRRSEPGPVPDDETMAAVSVPAGALGALTRGRSGREMPATNPSHAQVAASPASAIRLIVVLHWRTLTRSRTNWWTVYRINCNHRAASRDFKPRIAGAGRGISRRQGRARRPPVPRNQR